MVIYRDEYGYIITEEELRDEFEFFRKRGETEAKNFVEYVRNCTDKNGTLEEITIK